MSGDGKIPVEIRKITNPDGTSRTGAVTYLEDVLSTPDVKDRLLTIEKEYMLLVQRCLQILKQIRTPEGRPDARLRWELANTIYSFLNLNAKKIGVVLVDYKNALCEDLGISRSELHYVLRFRRIYMDLNELDAKINWSKYRELIDFTNDDMRKECETSIKKGKIKTDSEIRKFKKSKIKS
ncbi:hypothetical protein KAU30_04030 [Candidatus Bathyarchaeota archaeon]|nr:hypothetical protein [Candidatus Bathyarchaeota archaeon]